jgi:hypothetical protein
MNNLSWALIAIDIISNVSVISIALAVVCIVGILLSAFVYFMSREHDDVKSSNFAKRWLKRFAIAGLPLILVSICLPSKHTMRLVLVSEIGDRLSKTEAVTDISREAYEVLRKHLRSLNADKRDD